MEIVKDLGMKEVGAKQPVRFGIYKCNICGNEFEARTANIKSGNTKSCGCNKYQKPNPLRLTSMYSSWDHMKQRCSNPKNDNYQYYGARGITICAEWSSFEEFSQWALTNGWEEGLTIERDDVNGNYEPTNCSWQTMTVQNRNKRTLQANNTTGYRGVTLIKLKSSVKYKAEIMVDRVTHRLGRFSTAEEAALAYDTFISINNLEHASNGLYKP